MIRRILTLPRISRAAGLKAPSSTPSGERVAERAPTGSVAAPFRNDKEKREIARRLLAESDNNYTWVASQLGINTTTLWRWRKAGKV